MNYLVVDPRPDEDDRCWTAEMGSRLEILESGGMEYSARHGHILNHPYHIWLRDGYALKVYKRKQP